MANPKIDKMARRMAVADGHDPDKPMLRESLVAGQVIQVKYSDQPAWRYYIPYAKIILAGIQAEREAD